jgi:hypothetical protein
LLVSRSLIAQAQNDRQVLRLPNFSQTATRREAGCL